jgi:mono/diheme cytochrome c family protein
MRFALPFLALLAMSCTHPAPLRRPPPPSELGHVRLGDQPGILTFDGQPAFTYEPGGCSAGRFAGLDEAGAVLYYGQSATAGCEDENEGGTDRFIKLTDFAVCQELVIDVAAGTVTAADHWDSETLDGKGAPAWCQAAIAASKAQVAPAPAPIATSAGARLFKDQTCITCHTLDGKAGGGPTMKGLYGKEESFTDGNTLIVDEPYLRQAILDPRATTVQGFPADKMPAFKGKLSEEELSELIAYIKGLE